MKMHELFGRSNIRWSRWITVGLSLLAAAILASCGSGGDGDSAGNKKADSTPDVPEGDSRPRVEGKWRAIFTPDDEDEDEARVTWRVTSLCPAGACGFRVRSSTKTSFTFRFDKAVGDYLRRDKLFAPCGTTATGKTLLKKAYKVRLREELSISDSIIAPDGVDYATEMFGDESDHYLLVPEAVGECQEEDPTHSSIRVVRIDAPKGKPGSASPQGATGATGPTTQGE